MTTYMAGPLNSYQALLKAGELKPDDDQRALVERLQALHDALAAAENRRERSFFRGVTEFFGVASAPKAPRGVYIVGGVGRGKSMAMDLFFDTATVADKRRVHFHEFMAEVHAALKEWRAIPPTARAKKGKGYGDDPIPPVADQIAVSARLLCFDEMQVTDIADAMILGRLFDALISRGVTLVTTSNRPPDDLYKDGLNRQLFLPFIARLKAELDIISLDGPTDYRLDRIRGVQTYYFPADDRATNALRAAFFKMTDRNVDDADAVPSGSLTVNGRTLFVPKASKGVAVFSFKRLCGAALGAQDYLSVARNFHTVFLVGIPQMGPENRNESVRFRTLIDALYEHGVKFICSSAVPPEQLYPVGDGSFEFERTVSRLNEMQSDAYLARGHGTL